MYSSNLTTNPNVLLVEMLPNIAVLSASQNGTALGNASLQDGKNTRKCALSCHKSILKTASMLKKRKKK